MAWQNVRDGENGLQIVHTPKVMDTIVKFVLRDYPNTDNYVDNILTPSDTVDSVADALEGYGLSTKPAEELTSSRVLGLQIYQDVDGAPARWRRRDGDVACTEVMTKRQIFQLCGRLVSHYPVCCWLRPACSYLKRMACLTVVEWDSAVPHAV